MAAIMEIRRLMGLSTEPGMAWPPLEDTARIKGYKTYRKLFDGDHVSVFGKERRSPTYVAANLARNIVSITSDILFGEDFELEFDDAVADALVEQVNEIVKRNRLQPLMHESSLDCGYAGDVVFIVSRDDDGLARVHPQSPEMWFPEFDGDDQRVVTRHRFAWEREDGDEKFIRMVIHEPGSIRNELWLYDHGVLVREATPAEWRRLYDEVPPEVIETGVDEMLVVHVPNYRTARTFYGYSEYRGNESLFDALNARLTQVDRILTKHSDPILGLPQDVYSTLKAQGDIRKDRLDVVAQGPNGEKPEYVTWDGQLANNLAFIDMLVRQIASVTETAPQLLGIEDMGGNLSGRALRILLLRTLTKVGRRRRYYEHGVRELLRLGQLVEGMEPVEFEIKWPDGLPQDQVEDGEIVGRRIADGTLSRLTAIQRLDGVDEEMAQAELDLVNEEQDAARTDPALQNALRRPEGAQPGVSVTVGDMSQV